VEAPPVFNGGIVVDGGRITEIVQAGELLKFEKLPGLATLDFGDSLIAPGLINLHTHIEYSLLRALSPDAAFFPWVRSLMEATALWQPETWKISAQVGAQMAARAGTTCLVDSSYRGTSAAAIAESGLRGIVGLELFGVHQNDADKQWANWLEKLNRAQKGLGAFAGERVRFTVAPHAPYTVCPALWVMAKRWADERGQVVLAHVAETKNECHWFAGEDNLIDQHLSFAFSRGNAYDGDPVASARSWRRGSRSPIEHLSAFSLLGEKLLVAHAVHVSEADAKLLAEAGTAIAHCPRSNARLRNGIAPLHRFQEHGLSFGLGTDSLASAHDLDLLSEARFAIALQRAFNPESAFTAREALEAVTIRAARCIKMDGEIGSLRAGKRADMAIFAIPEELRINGQIARLDPFDLLIHGGCKAKAAFVDGCYVAGEALVLEMSKRAGAPV
jgi:cytosine/adenosine deaminase-related metal-dependent hydrolase